MAPLMDVHPGHERMEHWLLLSIGNDRRNMLVDDGCHCWRVFFGCLVDEVGIWHATLLVLNDLDYVYLWPENRWQ